MHSERKHLGRTWVLALIVLGLGWVGADVTVADSMYTDANYGSDSSLESEIEALGLDPEEITAPMRLDPEIRQWAEGKIPRGAPAASQLKILLDALRHQGELEFIYQAGYTGGAREVFHGGRYNCLSFSILFVSLARDLGLPAFFLMLDNVEGYERDGDLIVATQHITAGYGFVRDRTILEFDVGPEINYQLAAPISDINALALFYSNRGAELLRDGEPEKSLEMNQIATVLGPDLAQVWINLGVTQRRLGRIEKAQEAYLQALEVDPRNVTIYENMVALLRIKGEDHLVNELLPELVRRKNHNPYTYLTLGDLSLRDGRVDEAERFFRRAFRLARYEAETHAAMGISALASGERAKAHQWLEKAAEIDSENARAQKLKELLRAKPEDLR